MKINKYSELLKKMKIFEYKTKVVINKPSYVDELDELEFDTELVKNKYDLIIYFVFSIEEIESVLVNIAGKNILNENGYLYFLYPKKNNTKNLDYIHRDSLFVFSSDDDGYFRDTNLKFSRFMSFNQSFTICGLKNQLKSKNKNTSVKTSSNDYIKLIPQIREILKENIDNLNFYDSLSSGYQKDWARYIFSAKTDETKHRRIKDMKSIISKGFKSKDLYRISKKRKN